MIFDFNPNENAHSYGQHFIVGLSGTQLDESDKQLLGKLKPAGILLLKRNFEQDSEYSEWLAKYSALIDSVREYVERNEIIISIDHEGGKVHRTPRPLTHFTSASSYSSRCAEVATAMGTELASLGINVSWAPLTDIHSNPENPIIGDRAFGQDPEYVAECAIKYANALENCGVLACAKHYPGHGDTSTDSHLELPVLEINKQELLARELVPFKRIIDSGISLIMTAHILFPKIDPHFPATLSETILKGILREEFGYEGVVVSDDLDMHAVSEEFRREENMGQAMKAGCDMFIVARHLDRSSQKATKLAENIGSCSRANLLSEVELHASCMRIEDLFCKLKHPLIKELDDKQFSANADLAKELA